MPGPPKLAAISLPKAISSVKGAGLVSGVGVGAATGLGDGAGVADGVGRPTWATGRPEPGPSVAGSAAITSTTSNAGRTRRRTELTADRPLLLEGAPYQRLKDGFKQTEQEAEDQQEDQVDEEDAGDDNADEQPLREALHVEPHDLDQQRGHQQAEVRADRVGKAAQRSDGNREVAGKFGQRAGDQRTPRRRQHGGRRHRATAPSLALPARLGTGL